MVWDPMPSDLYKMAYDEWLVGSFDEGIKRYLTLVILENEW